MAWMVTRSPGEHCRVTSPTVCTVIDRGTLPVCFLIVCLKSTTSEDENRDPRARSMKRNKDEMGKIRKERTNRWERDQEVLGDEVLGI